MPELPEVETVVKALDRILVGKTIIDVCHRGAMRKNFSVKEAKRIVGGRKVLSVRRRAKYIIIECEEQAALLAHLGMTGSFRIEDASFPYGKHDRAAFLLDDAQELRYSDIRRFGFVEPVCLDSAGGLPDCLAGLGPEPLSRAFSARFLLEKSARRNAPVKIFIMDQAVVVGIGNIYASEALYAAGIDPRRPASSLSEAEWENAAREIKKVLRQSIRRGGSSIRNYRTVDGSEGGFQLALKVYGKKDAACPTCGETICCIRQGGRSTFFCPVCQK